MGFLSRKELENIGFAKLGQHIYISDKATFYNPSQISIGSYVRIDDFSILAAGEDGININNFVHFACFSGVFGESKITFNDFTGLSIRTLVLSSTIDYLEKYHDHLKEFTNFSQVIEFKESLSKPVVFERCSAVGAASLVMPGVTICSNSSVGALSSVYKDIPSGGFYWGNPARIIKRTSRKAINLLNESIANGFINIES